MQSFQYVKEHANVSNNNIDNESGFFILIKILVYFKCRLPLFKYFYLDNISISLWHGYQTTDCLPLKLVVY